VKIRVDTDLCQGHGVCAEEAPSVFALDAEKKLVILNDHPDESLREAVRAASKYCPTRALRLEEDSGGTAMPAFPRAELEEMIRRFVAANDEAGKSGDWSKMSRFYADDAIYSWNNGASWEFVARGRQQIQDWVFGTEMAGLEHWVYPYVRTLVDDVKSEVIGVWRQISPDEDNDGQPYEIAGTGGSWFRYAGNWQWAWQRDFFDHMNAGVVFGAMAKAQKLKPAMLERMKRGSNQPGWVPRASFDWYATLVNRED